MKNFFQYIRLKNVLIILFGTMVSSFGMCHVCSASNMTVGGIYGLTLLLEHYTGISPSITNLVLTVLCYIFGWRIFGKDFLIYSGIATLGYSFFYAVWERVPAFLPDMTSHPILVALLTAICIGIGGGLCVRFGGAPSGDDALAMSIHRYFHIKMQIFYFTNDALILLLSLTYIEPLRVLYGLACSLCAGQIVSFIATFKNSKDPGVTESTKN